MILFLSTIFFLILIIIFCDFFTNAIEQVGHLFNIQENSLGSIFAAIGTAFPETVLPLIAIFGAVVTGSDVELGKEVGKGAVLGSPFMLSTIAFFVFGVSIIILNFMKKRNGIINIQRDFLLRDLKFFLFAYTVGVLMSLTNIKPFKISVGIFLLIFYFIYALRTLNKEGDSVCEEECEELKLITLFRLSPKNRKFILFFQLIFAVVGIVISSHFFVENIKEISVLLGVQAMIISLFIAPVATELPETVNGIVWSIKGKDTLAAGNISGAMVFQACIPMAIGVMFTDWAFGISEILNVFCVYSAVLILYLSAKYTKEFDAKYLLLSVLPYVFYIISVLIYIK